ncbi:hypothetical protein CHLRE_06g295301v5 [Chlamydomonas reinhardtii]|uniref:Uncharacterized protein n=1 Tax=Chlamydomonas reinhardtii TaxID=3055 RepID=A0A2K3DQJ4_CHLRE|nr:uncharacterized protein CHLRE_06g295301v5 [Chlamydomonas reinhardtii]PNW82812.1 hypothetical protein CHLRE_06g295301v5 [Chlamydomonas reinhardtii]
MARNSRYCSPVVYSCSAAVAACPKTTADGGNDESPPTKTKTATASATLTPEEMEELMAKVTAAAHHAATAALHEYTTGEQYRLFRAILGWESLSRFTMSQLGRVVSAIPYPALGYETTARVMDQCFALNAWEGEQLLQGVSRLGHAVSSNSGWHSITVWSPSAARRCAAVRRG